MAPGRCSAGSAQDGARASSSTFRRVRKGATGSFWYPVVAETSDGRLNDQKGQHVKAEDAIRALDGARGGPVAEGNVGGGTGMICHEFKGGIGTASRRAQTPSGAFTVGALVQAIEVTPHRRRGLERAAKGLDLPVDALEDSPYVLVGTVEQIASQAREHAERFGVSRWTVFVDKPDAPPLPELAPVAEAFAAA